VLRQHHHARTDSTNDEALRLWRRLAEQCRGRRPEPVLISADVQTAGRGRQGRRWRSPAGGVWMTLAWPATKSAATYRPAPLVAGLAVAQAVAETTGVDPRIKWPNDLLIDDRKCGGILCQYEAIDPPTVIVGVGVNANLKCTELGRCLRHPATTLLEVLGTPVDLAALRGMIARRLVDRMRLFERDGLASMLGAIHRRLAWVGETIDGDRPGGRRFEGRFDGIDEAGCLRVTDPVTLETTAYDAAEVRHVSPTSCELNPTCSTMELDAR